MKKKIIIFFIISILFAATGGTYLLIMNERRTEDIDNLIMLHQVEILRGHLLLNIRTVEADLYSQVSRHPESVEAIVSHVNTMETTIKSCFECHHSDNITARLYDLDDQIDQFSHAFSRILTMQGNMKRHADEVERAHIIGDSLISKVNTMIVLTNSMLNKRTEMSIRDMKRTKLTMIALVAAGPILIAVLSLTAYAGFTKPIRVLLGATRKMKGGDLDVRISGLQDEFQELGDAFDDMAISLQQNTWRLEESEKRYRNLFENAADAIFMLSLEEGSEGKILQANHAAAEMHGYSVEELETMNIADLDSPDAALGIPMRIDRMKSGEWLRTEITHVHRNGTVFPVEISAGIIEVGDKKYILAIDRNIADRKRAEESLQRAQQIRIAGEMATGLAHEIKNPLAGIKATMEMLSHEPYLAEEDRNVLGKAIAEIKRIEYLMKSLLNFARPPKPQFVKTDVNAVMDTVLGLVQKDPSFVRDARKAIHIVKKYEQHRPAVMADPMQLQQIFMNLLLNAADAMSGGGILTVETAYDKPSDGIQIAISDTGTGVDVAMMDSIFQPFFTTKPKGTGLGLAITRRLVEEHEGRITITNRPEGGASFRIHLPAYREGEPQP
ncbi:MAG: PAS domain S-box protein [Nitrospiraceae bacterium]|nr:PAS domain S-box protein [Nitrospiraceae bacterium]